MRQKKSGHGDGRKRFCQRQKKCFVYTNYNRSDTEMQ